MRRLLVHFDHQDPQQRGTFYLGNRSVIVQLAHALAIINATRITETAIAQVKEIEAATNLKLECGWLELEAPFPYFLLNAAENPLLELELHLKCLAFFGVPSIPSKKDLVFSQYYLDKDQGRICFHFGKFTVVSDKDTLLASHARILSWDFENFIPVHGSLSMFVRGNVREKFLNSVDFLSDV
ncbi:hypothetical protein BJ741DRAFT_661946 [Chytriomyces cf. hyalinus JEL632]|nr:hypothetical protein BJ741DRAFT_661946 [Chytriomyces cf. hyalinus JEL632]